jgi:UDP-2-acetamido-3-amino-2,3-dideoxy-glucuronate N-acetyltransferase
MAMAKHVSVYLDEGALVGEGTHIWHFSHIKEGARIGKGCNIGQNCFVDSRAVIGDFCKLQNNVSVYSDVTLEDYVFCGPSCVFTNVMNPRCEIDRKHEFKKTLVRRGASLGANSTIVCGVTIGRYAFVGAGSVVKYDVPDYGLVVGSPAMRVGWMTRHGAVLHPGDFVESSFGKEFKVATCPISGWRYVKKKIGHKNYKVHCLDHEEDLSL